MTVVDARGTLVGSNSRDLPGGGRVTSSVLMHGRDPVLHDLEVASDGLRYVVRDVPTVAGPHRVAALLPPPTASTDGTEARLLVVPGHGRWLMVTAGHARGTVHALEDYGTASALDLPPPPRLTAVGTEVTLRLPEALRDALGMTVAVFVLADGDGASSRLSDGSEPVLLHLVGNVFEGAPGDTQDREALAAAHGFGSWREVVRMGREHAVVDRAEVDRMVAVDLEVPDAGMAAYMTTADAWQRCGVLRRLAAEVAEDRDGRILDAVRDACGMVAPTPRGP